MGIVAKYKFNQEIYADFIPEFNSGFTDYTITDEIGTDGFTIRTIGNDSGDLPTLMRFGQVWIDGENSATDKSKSLLGVYECDTSNITDMNSMFRYCDGLTSINLSNFNTSKIVNMYAMFFNCNNLTSLDVSNFNTSKVISMEYMFYGCSLLTSLDVSNFDTSKVTTMYRMFNNCNKLTSLDLSNWDTSKVTNMAYVFASCNKITSLDLSSFDTSNVTTTYSMFQNCTSLISLDLSSFDTSNVTYMGSMFNGCSSLTSLDVSSFDTSNVTTMYAMFYLCKKLTYINTNFNTSNVTTMYAMFSGCNSLTSLDLSSFNTSKVTNMSEMFQNCSLLTSLDVSNFNTENVTDMDYILTNTPLLTNIGAIYCNSSTINKISSLITTNTKIYYSLPNISELESHDNIEYIKYIFPTKVQLPPHIQLHSLPDGTCDELDIKTGILTRRIDENYALLEEETTEKLILNYNNSCNYGVILPRGTSDNYNVITNEYTQNLDFIPIDGSIAFDTATLKDTTVKFSVALSKFEVDTTNVRGSDGIYCDNDLFKYEANDNDYEHAYIENDTTLYIYVNKSRLSSYDQVGFQLYLSSNPFNVYYAMITPIISYVNYENLDPEKASWEMLDCTEDGSITIESGEMDKTLLLDCLDYVAPTKNRFEIDLLKANTQYTIYAEGVSGRIQLNFGGNIVNFTSGNIYTSGETQLVEFYTDNEIKNLIIIEGDTRSETIEFFEGLKSSENITVISSNAPFVFGKGGKIQ